MAVSPWNQNMLIFNTEKKKKQFLDYISKSDWKK